MKENNIAITVQDVRKSFKLPSESNKSLKSQILHFRRPVYSVQHALKDINFKVKKGEFFGIVGRNGSGKSTLLKLLAGIYVPSSGTIQIHGKLTPFIELGVGFNQELSGRENVYLNGALLGFTRSQMDQMYTDIVTFAELEDHMDVKLKNFSSGMQVRLAFSIAIRAQSDILLIDEVLAVGDSAFQKKCYDVLRQLRKNGQTIVFVTHNMADVERFCDRVLVVDKGKQIGVFEPRKARQHYEELNLEGTNSPAPSTKEKEKLIRWGSGVVRAENITLNNSSKKSVKLQTGDELVVAMDIHEDVGGVDRGLLLGIGMHTEDGHNLFGPNTKGLQLTRNSKHVELSIPHLPLRSGVYSLSIAVFDEDGIETYDHLDREFKIIVSSNESTIFGSVEIPHTWSIQ